MSSLYSDDDIDSRLRLIISNIANVDITDTKASLFGFTYSLSAETLIYILLRASMLMGFAINELFVDDMGDCSFDSLKKAIIKNGR